MRTTPLLAALFFLSGCALSSRSNHHSGSEAGEPALPAILGADEGEKLLMADGRHVLLKSAAGGGILMGSEALPPGTAIPVHCHDGCEEIIFIHEGNVQVTLGDEQVLAGPGTTVVVPPGTWHGVAAHGDEGATMLFIFPGSDMAAFFRRVGFREGGVAPALTPEDWSEIMERHRMRARA